ncbi:ABC transporter ATP-binding protein [Companilactobacillus mishanensis]|uniref:ABC transporter ATP-binding protein n=1 Tax=Companilactobacillus mishanensis TaxID=2486008 RepID=A0ABW9P8M5_9LACO|nr:ABC transporter ATP-binding protein [Companilactobacillus mishanensis]MQS45503.1 ABC transporter ATP-binding protein [Companilactobacillus mishanensis]
MNDILNFDHVSVQRGKRQILNDISWRVKAKENWAILGLNGAGKTTLLKMIHGDLWPTSGSLEVLGGKFGHISIPELKTKIGWVSTALQDELHPGDIVDEIVLSGKFASIGIYQDYSKDDMEQARQLLCNLGGEKLLSKPYAVLSQGERQLVLIARALMTKPQLLILDEPCNGLDLFAREELLERIQHIAESPDSPALLLVSHYTEEILPVFDHILLLRAGNVVATGQRNDLLSEENLTSFYQKPIAVQKIGATRVAVYPK